MNPTTLNVAFKTASNLWSQFNNYREEKSREAYTALEEAAQKMDERDNSAFAEPRRQAGAVTRAAHSRLERALEEFNDYREDATERLNDAKEEATKKAKKARKQAKKDSQKAQKNLKKKSAKVAKKQKKNKKSSKGWIFAGIIALLSAAAGGAYYWLRPTTSRPRPRRAWMISSPIPTPLRSPPWSTPPPARMTPSLTSLKKVPYAMRSSSVPSMSSWPSTARKKQLSRPIPPALPMTTKTRASTACKPRNKYAYHPAVGYAERCLDLIALPKQKSLD